MSNVGQNREPLCVGEVVADVEVKEKLGMGGGCHSWSGTHEDGRKAVVFGLDGGMGPMLRDKFLAAATESAGVPPLDGVLPIVAVDPIAGAYVGDVDATGTLADLPILHWDVKRRVALFRRLCEIVGGLHDAGITHGWLRPENVLLDNDFAPIVANAQLLDIGALCRTDAGMVWLHRTYAPPEVRHGATADTSADTFALGRILHFALAGEEPDEKDERTPRLDALLKDHSNALVRIVRKCTTSDQSERYTNASEIADELDRVSRHVPVGMPHPDIDGKEESSMVDDERMRSRPPPRSKSKPPRSTGVAIELTTANKSGVRFWSVGIAIGLGILGLLMLTIPMGLAYGLGMDTVAIDITMWASALPLGFATPGFTQSRQLTRLFSAVVIAAIIVFSAPLDKLREARKAGLAAGDVSERVAAMKELMANGEYVFVTMDLAGADLSNMDFSKIVFDGTSMRGANCSNAKFRGASLDNVDFTGADLSGAHLGETPAQWMKGLEQAKCDAATILPQGYVCKDQAPAPQ